MNRSFTHLPHLLLSIFFLSIISGCTLKSPSAVAEEFLNAISFGDYDRAKELASDGSQSALESLAAMNDGQDFEFEITGEEINGDYARVHYLVKETNEEQHLRLRKDPERGWVVIFSKGDLPQTKVEMDNINDLGRGLGKAFEGLGDVVDTLGKTMGKVAKEIDDNSEEWAREMEREMKKNEKEWKELEKELEKK